MTRLRNWPPPPASPDEAGAAGPGLPGWQPLPEAEAGPSPGTPHELLDAIERDTLATLDRCAAKLEALEALYHATPAALYRRARERVAAERAS